MFQDYLTTAVGDGEVVTEVRVPALDGWGFGYQKFNRRAEDWAMVAVVRARARARRRVRGRPRRPDEHGLGAAAGDGGRGGAARPAARRRPRSRRRPSRPTRAPTPPATSTRPRSTSATWRGCCAAARCKRPRGRLSRAPRTSAAARQRAALILAAGAGTRFGDEPKLLATLDGRPLLDHVVAAARDAAIRGPRRRGRSATARTPFARRRTSTASRSSSARNGARARPRRCGGAWPRWGALRRCSCWSATSHG